MPFSWFTTARPILALAPMAGVTDASYRQLIKRVAPETIVYTEFLSSDALAYGAEKTLKMLEFDPAIERPFIVQIFGASPAKFLEACKVIEQIGADGIDINMGCPAAKIVSSCYGSALIRNPKLAAELVHAATNAVSIPVSVKTRLGWDKTEELIPFCKGLVEAGAKALSIHGRRYHDKFAGAANWDPIYALKREVSVPVIGNGDIASVDDALAKIGNLDGVMVGRGTFGNPWVMREISEAFGGLKERDELTGRWVIQHAKNPAFAKAMAGKQKPNSVLQQASASSPEDRMSIFRERLPFILEHCDLSVKTKGEKRGVLEMRRHLSSYIKGFDGAKELRMRVLTLEHLDDVKTALQAV